MIASVTRGPAQASGTLTLGGDLTVNRLGFGARRLTGDGMWGPPADYGAALGVLRRAVELGVNFIDTAGSYGPHISEEMIREALHPYTGLVIATKAGLVLTGPGKWTPLGNPNYLRQECEMSLRRLGVDAIDLFQLHLKRGTSGGERRRRRDHGH
jgi:aryl-alcohol dehydrogenase-like predicted oxidoreductase